MNLDGSKNSYVVEYNHGIYLDTSSGTIRYNTITENFIQQNSQYGICQYNCSDSTITGNILEYNGNGIRLGGGSNNATGNIVNNNTKNGIYSGGAANAIVGNVCNYNDIGIILSNGTRNAITGNTCFQNNQGIYLGSQSNNNTITGNTCIRENGASSDYTAMQYTIYLYSSNNNLVVGNNIMGKNYTNSGTNNTFANNKYN